MNIRPIQAFISSVLFAGLCMAVPQVMSQNIDSTSFINNDIRNLVDLPNSVGPEVKKASTTTPMDPNQELSHLKLIAAYSKDGLSESDILQLKSWLVGCYFPEASINVLENKRGINFSGTVNEAETCFHTQMVTFVVFGPGTGIGPVKHFANKDPLKVPGIVASVITKISGLDDFGTDEENFLQVTGATIPFMQAVENCAKDTNALTACGNNMNGVPGPIVGQTEGYLDSLTVTVNGVITATANAKIADAPTYVLTPTILKNYQYKIMWVVSGTCKNYTLCSTQAMFSE